MRLLLLLFLCSSVLYGQNDYIDQVDEESLRYQAAIVYKDGKAGLLRLDGSLIVPCIHKQIIGSSDGYFAASKYIDKQLKYGFYSIDGEEKIPFRFDQASYFKHGLAAVRLGEKWGFIDENGNWKIDAQYDKASHFTNGYALVELGERRYFIDTLGNRAFGRDFEKAQKFRNGFARVTLDGKFTFIDPEGNDISGDGYGVNYIFPEQGMMNIFDIESGKIGHKEIGGKITLPTEYEESGGFFKGDVTCISKTIDGQSKYAFVRANGTFISDFQYDRANPFHNQYGKVGMVDKSTDTEAIKYGVIDHNNNIVIPIIYNGMKSVNWYKEKFYHPKKSYFIIKSNGNYGVINSDNKLVIPCEYKSILYNRNGKFKCYGYNDEESIIDVNGKIHLKTKSIMIGQGIDFYPGLSAARDKVSKKQGIIDYEGNWILNPIYGTINIFKDLRENVKI